MTAAELAEEVLRVARADAPAEERARRAAGADSRPHRAPLGRDLPRDRGGGQEPGLEWSRSTGSSELPARTRPDGRRDLAIRSIVVSNDVASDSRYLTNQASTGSELIAPVLVEERVVGTLDVEDPSKDAFDEDARALYELIAAALVDLYR